jgi:GT2 family glycosyltransferase
VSAVVVAYGAPPERLRRCLDSLARSEGVALEIVVVDNGSPDGGVAVTEVAEQVRAEHPDITVHVLRSPSNGGFASGVRLGLAVTHEPDALWLLNDDARVAPHTLALCAGVLDRADRHVIAVSPLIHLSGGDPFDAPSIDTAGLVLKSTAEAFSASFGDVDNGNVPHLSTCFGPCFAAAMFRPHAFTAAGVGPLDERYFLYYEDVDWAVRARRAGFEVIVATGAGVVHDHAASTSVLGEARRYAYVQRNLLVLATRHFALRHALGVWGGRLVVHLKGLITGPYRTARIRAVAGAVLMAPQALLARRDDRRAGRQAEWWRYDPLEQVFADAGATAPGLDIEAIRSRQAGSGRAIP